MVCIVYVRFELIAHRFIKWNKKKIRLDIHLSMTIKEVYHGENQVSWEQQIKQKNTPNIDCYHWFGIRLKSVRSLVSKQCKPSACIWCMEMILAKVNNTEKKSALTTLTAGNLTLSLCRSSYFHCTQKAHLFCTFNSFAFSSSLSLTSFHPLFDVEDVWFQFFRVTEPKKGHINFITCQLSTSMVLKGKQHIHIYTRLLMPGELIYQNQTCLTRFIQIRNWFFPTIHSLIKLPPVVFVSMEANKIQI